MKLSSLSYSSRPALSVFAVIAGLAVLAEPLWAESRNLAFGGEVVFVPAPAGTNAEKEALYSRTLTDGLPSTATKSEIWRDRGVPTWSYQSRVHVAIDLKRSCSIEEVSLRLLGGTAPGGGQGKSFPTGVEVFVSENGEDYYKVVSCTRWRTGDFARYGVPKEEGKAWVHELKFPGLKTAGRYVGFRIHGTGMTAMDEISVLGNEGKELSILRGGPPGGEPSEFTVKSPQFYFHKPSLQLATNVPLPVPIGISTPPDAQVEKLTFTLELPAGVELQGGNFGKTPFKALTPEAIEGGGTRYRVSVGEELRDSGWNMRSHFGRLYFQATGWKNGQSGALRYRFDNGAGWESPFVSLPITSIEVPVAPRLKKIMVGQGWWYPFESLEWPDALASFRTLGINTLSYTVSQTPSFSPSSPEMMLVKKARAEGFMVSIVDMTIMRLLQKHPDKKELFCQYSDGEVGNSFCPSYRGPYWQEELRRFGAVVAAVQPTFASLDIEVWKSADRLDFDFSNQSKETRKCTRCEADYKASGLKSADLWSRSKGLELWSEIAATARAAMKEAGGGELHMSGYNFRPGQTYQGVWNFDKLLEAGLLEHSQVSNYNCLYPELLASIGDRIRADRKKLEGKGSVMPWITPGDAGNFPGELFRWAMLEAYTNGSTGIWFYSNRNWDAESLIALNQAVRAIAPVEEIITEGHLLGSAGRVKGRGRLSGMQRGSRIVLLVADYAKEGDGSVTVQLQVPAPSKLVDLTTGATLRDAVPAGPNTLSISLEGASARILALEPVSDSPSEASSHVLR